MTLTRPCIQWGHFCKKTGKYYVGQKLSHLIQQKRRIYSLGKEWANSENSRKKKFLVSQILFIYLLEQITSVFQKTDKFPTGLKKKKNGITSISFKEQWKVWWAEFKVHTQPKGGTLTSRAGLNQLSLSLTFLVWKMETPMPGVWWGFTKRALISKPSPNLLPPNHFLFRLRNRNPQEKQGLKGNPAGVFRLYLSQLCQ